MIEELKLIIEMLGGIQEDAYSLVVAYFCFMLFKFVVITGSIMYVIRLAVTKISEACLQDGHEYTLRRLRGAMGVGCPGSINRREIESMMEWVRTKEKN